MKNISRSVVLTVAATLFCGFLSASSTGFAQAPSGSSAEECKPTQTEYPACTDASLSEQKTEQLVLQQILKGLPVKVDQGAVVRGCFIRELMTKNLGIPNAGITIDGATIRGPIDIRNEDVGIRVKLIHCIFQDDFNMQRSHFSKGLSFEGSTFGSELNGPGRLDAEASKVDFDLTLDNATFRNCLTFLKSLHVGVDLSMRGTKFYGDVDFTGAVVGSNLFADKENPEDHQAEFFRSVDFEGLRVGLDANLTDAAFHGFTSFSNATFNNLALDNSTFDGDVNFKSTHIDDFYLGENPAIRFKGNLMIEDLTFQYMSPEDLDQLKGFAEKSNSTREQARNNTQLYSTLETILRKHGHDDWGDEVYIAGKRKEREYLPWYSGAWGYFQDKFIGYGRHVGRLLWWSLIFIVIGSVIFRSKNKMELKKPDAAAGSANKYCPFLYTLDLFLPIIGLGYADTWTPKTAGGRIYKPIHVIVGHLFIPIGLAAWTGIIK
jgi:Pentapeptide repeats (9 copies)